jgi:transposase
MSESAGFCQITHLHEQQGLSAAPMAATLSLDPRTVASWLTQERFRPRQARQRARKRDPFKAQMVRRLERSPSAAAQVCPRLGAQGCDGGSALVKAYGRTVRPTRQPAFRTLAFAPGACAQGDGGSFGAVQVGHTRRRLRFFVMVLCDSRMLSVACTVSQTLEHVLACHQHACAYFGAMPPTVMVDHLTAAVLKRAVGDAPGLNPRYADCAAPNGFRSVPCHVGQGHEKGRGENGVGDVKKHCLAGRDLPACSALHPAARPWLETVATVRLQGETRPKPTDLGHQEKSALHPLPMHPCDIATVSQVRASRQFRLPLDPNRSAVPAHRAGHALPLTTSPDRLCLSLGDHRIARHVRSSDR